uniref:Uncharacterized protein n=1 Tax=Anopheles atroparvus TaxID=41427 RepID=A0AAG5DJB8_ANOAO
MDRIICWLAICIMVGSNAYHIDQNLPNAQTYHNQQDDENAFNYGYQVENINNQFQHKQKGQDDVTYGCYGHVDPDGRKQLTFFVADRFGYRVVLTGQPTTVYPLTSALLEVSGVSGGRQIPWKDLPFPAACQPNDVTGSSSSVFQANLQGQRFDEAYAAESRDAFQRTLLEPVTRNPTGGDDAVSRPQPFDSQRPPANYQAIANLGPKQQDLGQLDSSSSNNNAVINAHASTSNAANQADKGQAAGQSAPSVSWQPFLSADNSFMLSSQCERAGGGGHPGEQTLTLYIPFRISCSDMQAFEAALAKLTAQFHRAEC